MRIIKLYNNKYIITYLLLYIFVLSILHREGIDIGELLASALLIGILFTSIAYFLSSKSTPIFDEKNAQKKEFLILILIIFYFALYITFYYDLLNFVQIIKVKESPIGKVVIGISKLLFIVIIPMLIYYFVYGFKLKDWGINLSSKSYFSRQYLFIFLIFSIIMLVFQYFLGNGAIPLRQGLFSGRQILIGLLFNYSWLLLTVGVVEEFFFRAFLQSRISVILKSDIGGVILSALIFGLAHAPGIYLRGGGVISNLGPNPSFLISISYSLLVLSVAGFFLSVIWLKTKNFFLIVAIHASVDLLPSLPNFIDLWGIK